MSQWMFLAGPNVLWGIKYVYYNWKIKEVTGDADNYDSHYWSGRL